MKTLLLIACLFGCSAFSFAASSIPSISRPSVKLPGKLAFMLMLKHHSHHRHHHRHHKHHR